MTDSDMKKALMNDVNKMVEKHGLGEEDWLLPVEKYEGELRQIALTTNEVVTHGPGGSDLYAEYAGSPGEEKTCLRIVEPAGDNETGSDVCGE